MKRDEIVAELRELQGLAYGAAPLAEVIADKDERERCRSDHDVHLAVRIGSMQWSTRDLARRIDRLIERMSRGLR